MLAPKKLAISVLMFIAIAAVVGWWQYFQVSRSQPDVLHTDGYLTEIDGDTIYLVSANGTQQALPKNVTAHLMGKEWLTSFILPVDPAVPHAVFLSTQEVERHPENGTDACQSINRIYRYVIGKESLEEIYLEVSTSNSPVIPGKCRILRIAGRTASRLIILVDDPDNSPGPCTNIWVDYKHRFLQLDTTTGVIEKYAPPEEFVSQQKTIEETCLDSVSPQD